jgi:hypothetical protein
MSSSSQIHVAKKSRTHIQQALERFLAYLARWATGKRERRACVFYRNLTANAA